MTQSAPGGKVAAGFFSFTQVTDPTAHREYNEWHQLDHLPEQMPLGGIAFGQRWVASPRCRALTVDATGDLSFAHYLTIYLIVEPVIQAMKDFYDLAVDLHEKDRFFAHRRAVTAGPLEVSEVRAAPRVLISGAAVPYRPNRGVYVIVGANPGVAQLLGIQGVAGVWAFRPGEVTPQPPSGAGGRFEDQIVVCYLDGDPVETGSSIMKVLGAGTSLRFAGAFETITPWSWDWFDDEGGG
jgi:hypothetical protein